KATSEAKLKKFKKELQIDLENLSGERQQLRQRLEVSRKAQMEWVQLEQLSAELVRLRTESADIVLQKKELPSLKEKLQLQVEASRQKLENLQLKRENQLLIANMEELRSKLREGEPCQLCGSLEHPYAKDLPEKENFLDSQLRDATENWRQLSHQLSSVTTTLEGYEKRYGELTAAAQHKEKELHTRKAAYTSIFAHLKPEEGISWEELCKGFEGQLLELEDCEKEQRVFKAVAAAIPLHRELNQVLQEGKVLKQQLDGLYSGTNIHNDCQKFQNNWLKFSQLQENLRTLQEELKEKLQQKNAALTSLEIQLQPVLELEFSSIPEARKALFPEPKYQQLSSQQEELARNLSTQETSLKVLDSQLQELKSQDSNQSREELQEDLGTRNLQLKTVKQDCEDLRRLLHNDADLQKELEALRVSIARHEKKIRRWKLLNELIGDAVGKKFNDFAQDLSLSQLIHLANIRLRDLSDRYRIDKPEGDEDDGLVAIDEHMGGQRRSVKTLSGGETFLLSLSMALALSDL